MQSTLLGPYRIETPLGSGGMGSVHLATALEAVHGVDAGTSVAVKVLHPHLAEDEEVVERFLREIDAGRRVQHPNVARTFGGGPVETDGETHYVLAMEVVEGQSLRDLLEEMGRLPEELCRQVGAAVARGLAAVHAAGLIHRDVKPENILLTPDHQVKLMDLGIARVTAATRFSREGAFLGSVQYAAPEQFEPEHGDVDGRADLRALGTTLYEIAAGENPFVEDHVGGTLRRVIASEPVALGEVHPDVSPFLEELVHTLLHRRPDQRIGEAAQLATILEEGEAGTWWATRARAIRELGQRSLHRIHVPRESKVYGRERELRLLRRAYDDICEGNGRVVFLQGEGGIGKTRLVDEFIRQLRADGVALNFLFGAYTPRECARAEGAFSTAYREHFGTARLEETLRRYLPHGQALLPSFAALLRGERLPDGTQPLPEEALRTGFVRTAQMLATELPTVLVVDDLHLASDEGRALFATMALSLRFHRVLLIGTSQPDLPRAWRAEIERLEHASSINLERLGPRDVGRMLVDAFRSERLADELGFRILTKSDGNPYFVFEFIRGLREGKFISRLTDGTWVSTRVVEHLEIPSSVLDLIQSRLSDLSDVDRDLLDIASCCGFSFDPLLVGHMVGLDRIPALKRLAHLERSRRVVRAVGLRFEFDHRQIQEALYDRLPVLLRQTYHSRLADTLLELAGADTVDPSELDGDLLVDLCRHLFEAARARDSLRYLDAAVDHLVHRNLNDVAIDLADRALTLPGLVVGAERVALLERKAGRLDMLGRTAARRDVLEEALTLADELGDAATRTRVRAGLGVLCLDTADLDEARRWLEEALAIAGGIGGVEGDAVGASSHAALARLHRVQGRYAEARTMQEQHVEIARRLGDRSMEATAWGTLGHTSYMQDRYAEAREHIQRQLEIAQELGDRKAEAIATGNLGPTYVAEDMHAEGRECYERFLQLSRELGYRRGEAVALANIGSSLLRQGEHAAAITRYEEGLALIREMGDRANEAEVSVKLGNAFFARGRCAEALTYQETTIRIAEELGIPALSASACLNLALTLSTLGDQEGALVHADAGVDGAVELDRPYLRAYGLIARAEVRRRAGRIEPAGDDLQRAVDAARVAGVQHLHAAALCGLGVIRLDQGATETGEAHLRTALEQAAGLALYRVEVSGLAHLARCAPDEVDRARERLAEFEERVRVDIALEAHHTLWGVTGDDVHRARAAELLDQLRTHAPAAHLDRLVENVPAHREIAAATAMAAATAAPTGA